MVWIECSNHVSSEGMSGVQSNVNTLKMNGW
jgi:hypothetical protein